MLRPVIVGEEPPTVEQFYMRGFFSWSTSGDDGRCSRWNGEKNERSLRVGKERELPAYFGLAVVVSFIYEITWSLCCFGGGRNK